MSINSLSSTYLRSPQRNNSLPGPPAAITRNNNISRRIRATHRHKRSRIDNGILAHRRKGNTRFHSNLTNEIHIRHYYEERTTIRNCRRIRHLNLPRLASSRTQQPRTRNLTCRTTRKSITNTLRTNVSHLRNSPIKIIKWLSLRSLFTKSSPFNHKSTTRRNVRRHYLSHLHTANRSSIRPNSRYNLRRINDTQNRNSNHRRVPSIIKPRSGSAGVSNPIHPYSIQSHSVRPTTIQRRHIRRKHTRVRTPPKPLRRPLSRQTRLNFNRRHYHRLATPLSHGRSPAQLVSPRLFGHKVIRMPLRKTRTHRRIISIPNRIQNIH